MSNPFYCCKTGSVDRNSSAALSSSVSSKEAPPTGRRSLDYPSFEEVLSGKSPYEPWVPSTFLEFLHSERNEENFFFFEEVEAYKAVKGLSKEPPAAALLILPGDVRSNPKIYAIKIIDTFVKEDSPRQVNISAVQRARLLNDVLSNALESQGYEPEIFSEAQEEVKKLMFLDSWPRFRRKMMTQNITQHDSKFRLYEGAAILLVTLLALGLMLGFYAPRWYIFILAIPLYMVYEDFITYKMSFCMRNAMKGLRDKMGMGGEKSPIACPLIKASHRHRIRKVFFVIALSTVLTTAFFFSLTYIIEAGVGRTLYG